MLILRYIRITYKRFSPPSNFFYLLPGPPSVIVSNLSKGSVLNLDVMPEVQRLIALQEETASAVCFTHGNLSSSDILVSGDKFGRLADSS